MTRRNNLTKRGFTVLEVTIAVSVIAILAGLLIYAISHLTASAKANQTRIVVQDGQGILQEFVSNVGLNRDTGNWPWQCFLDTTNPPAPLVISTSSSFSTGTPSASPNTLSLNYWSAPWRYQSPTSAGGTLSSNDTGAPMLVLSGPFSLSSISSGIPTDPVILNRNTSPAVLYTQLGMKMMGGLSACRAMLSSIPSGSTMIPDWNPTCSWYAIGNTVKVTNGSSVTYWQCQIYPPPSGPPATPNWITTTNPDPILLDAWGNPILLVPSSGLVNVWTNISKSNPIPNPPPPWGSAPTGGQIQTWVATKSQPLLAYQQAPITAPDNKPFFVSAGPDGDFTTGDDNIYSFNK